MVAFDWQGMTSYQCSVVIIGVGGTVVELSIYEKACCQVPCSCIACDWTTGKKRSHSDSIQITDK